MKPRLRRALVSGEWCWIIWRGIWTARGATVRRACDEWAKLMRAASALPP